METSISAIREDSDTWYIETLAAIKFELSKKWKISPRLGMDVKLFISKGGRIEIVHIGFRMIHLTEDT